MSKKAVIYCRTASEEQKGENLALIRQIDMCLTVVKESDCLEVTQIIVDKGISNIDRRQFRLMKLLKTLKTGNIKTLVTYDTYRLSRNYEDYSEFKELLDVEEIEPYYCSSRLMRN